MRNLPQRSLRIVLLVGCAAALNCAPVPGPGGVVLLVGSFAYMPAVLVSPAPWAALAAAVAMLPTLSRFGHPFLLTVGTLEALWLCAARRWTSRHPAVADAAFWLVAGIPILLATAIGLSRLPTDFALILTVKQALNQWTAVVTAQFLIRDTQFGGWLAGQTERRERLRDLVFDYVFALALVPLLLVGGGMTVMLRRLSEESDRQVLATSAQRVSQQIGVFLRAHGAAVESAARLAGRTPGDATLLLEAIRSTHPAFITMLATNREGRITAASPAAQLPNLGAISVADREYFQTAMRDGRTSISHVFRGRGFGTDILVAVSAPWYDVDGNRGGVIEGSLDVHTFGSSVVQNSRVKGLRFVIADANGRVIHADADTGLRPLSNLRYDALAPLLDPRQATSRFEFDRLESDGRRSLWVAHAEWSPESRIFVIVARPLLAAVENIGWIYGLIGAVMAAIVVTAVLVARAASRRLSAPLELFARNATTQAERTTVEPIAAPTEPLPYEFAQVFAAFNRLASQLQDTYEALRRQNANLDRRVAERTRELEAARRAAESANSSKSDFIAMTSHEIRTPLNAMIGLADVLAMENHRPDVAEKLRIIAEAGRKLLAVTNDLLDLSRMEAGKLEIAAAPVDLAALCREVHALLALRAGQQRVAFRLDLDQTAAWWVQTDAGRLRQVLINLVGNALKFTTSGEVRLGLAVVPEGPDAVAATFSVSDTGPGIAPDEQAKLFQPYVQLTPGSDQRGAGTGLGLVISRRLVQLLGGALQLRSRPGEGSTFHFTLPLVRLAAPAVPAPATPPALPSSPRRELRVLVADDNDTNQEVMRAMLEPLVARVDRVASAGAAIAALQREPFDLAFIDLEMPDADGFTVPPALQGTGTVTCPLIAFSAYPRQQMLAKCQAAGFADFLSKPIARRELLRLLDDAARAQPA